MSAPPQDRPTAILIRDSERTERRPWYRRRRNVLALVGLFLIPGVALAAVYLWATFTGTATVNTDNQQMRIAAISGTTDPASGVSCPTGPGAGAITGPTTVNLAPTAQAFILTTDGVAGPRQTAAGECTYTLTIDNQGPRDVNLTATIGVAGNGWTITAANKSIPQFSQGQFPIVVKATDQATTGAITGSVKLEPVPLPAGG